MKKNYGLILLILLFSISSCEKGNNKVSSPGEQIYFNSFESQSDVDGWQGNAFNFSNEVPRNGGERSLRISGGCIIPHAQNTLAAQSADCNIIFKLWGKNQSNGGVIYLGVNKAGYNGTEISISEKGWTLYESQDTIFWPANTSLTLGIIAGGILESSILVDMIEVRKLGVEP